MKMKLSLPKANLVLISCVILFNILLLIVVSGMNRSQIKLIHNIIDSEQSQKVATSNILQSIVYLTIVFRNESQTVKKTGTGFFINDKGTLLTVKHLFDANENGLSNKDITDIIITWNNKTLKCESHGIIPNREFDNMVLEYDIAIVQAELEENEKTRFIRIGDSKECRIGDDIILAGFPLSGAAFKIPNKFGIKGAFLLRTHIGSSFSISDIDSGKQIHKENMLFLPIEGIKGLSGAPVYHIDTQSVVAIYKGGATRDNQRLGISKVESINIVREIFEQEGIEYIDAISKP